MHPPEVHERVRELAGQGLNDSRIGRELGLSRSTVREIRAPRYTPVGLRTTCSRCWKPTSGMLFQPGEYAEILGLYLGDGDISRNGRAWRLRLHLDSRYEQIVRDVRRMLERPFFDQRVGVTARPDGCTIVSVHSTHLPCLFPQHGPGKKHERPIVLEPWQRELVAEAPWAFLRGLTWSDGCFFINRTGKYRYLSVCFDNWSDDIRGLFAEACDRVGVQYRRSGRSIRIYRRESVALLSAFVGSKR